jgi:hypothetical protein
MFKDQGVQVKEHRKNPRPMKMKVTSYEMSENTNLV